MICLLLSCLCMGLISANVFELQKDFGRVDGKEMGTYTVNVRNTDNGYTTYELKYPMVSRIKKYQAKMLRNVLHQGNENICKNNSLQ